MTIVFSNTVKAFLLEAVTASAVQFIIDLGEYEKFLESTGDYSYAQLVDASGNKEIVRVDISASSAHIVVEETYSGGLTVTRAQGGTSARAWPRGTMMYQEITETFLNDVHQKAGHRSVAYSPSGVLASLYFGEKVYRSDSPSWWKSTGVAGTKTWVQIA